MSEDQCRRLEAEVARLRAALLDIWRDARFAGGEVVCRIRAKARSAFLQTDNKQGN
jgi:hypothetical protein